MGRTVITGGGGFLGQRLSSAIRGPLTLIDQTFPSGSAHQVVRLDIGSDPVVLPDDTTIVYHLAAVVSAGAEADFDLGMRVNVDGLRSVLDACRALGTRPKVVFASSVAAFGGALPDVLDDTTWPRPTSSYGTQKVIGEYLVNDYSRKGYIEGVTLRLPTVVVRPGRPNLAASSFASGIIREPLAGEMAICPVAPTTELWVTSPDRVVESLIQAASIPESAWPDGRVVNLPGLTVSVSGMLESLGRVAGTDAVGRVRFVADERIADIVGGWPARFVTAAALRLGFGADTDFDSVVFQYSSQS